MCYFDEPCLFVADGLHVALHAFQFLGQIVDVIVGLLHAGVDQVDQIIDLVYLQAIQRGTAAAFPPEGLSTVDLVGLAAEGFFLLGHEVAAVAHEVLRVDGLFMGVGVRVAVGVCIDGIGSEERLGGLMRGLFGIGISVEEE